MERYRPYKKQLEFHNAGFNKRERLLRAGNQQGKTYSAAAECAFHATGLYPDWWKGHRFEKATLGWAGNVTGEVTRDTVQRLLTGTKEDPGSGLIPRDCIVDITPSRSVADLADTITIKHVSGENSTIKLKYYEQGREKWQSATVDWIWLDEECDIELYTEALTRTNATNGIVFMTFTPLLGMSDVVLRFLTEESIDRSDTNMTIYDAEHIDDEQRRKIIESYPKHEREARTMGTPILGSGRIFPIAEEDIKVEAFDPSDIPGHWRTLGGLDFGWDHPTAAVKLLYDPDADIIYVTHAYKVKEQTPTIHASALRKWGKDLMFSWPHDGLQHDKGSGEQLKNLYEDEGLGMLAERAQFEDGGNGVEAGVSEMLMRMETGRWKVYGHLNEWFEEFRLYHRKKGQIVKQLDDLISASRYAMMDLRYATAIEGYGNSQSIRRGSWMTA